MAIRVLLVDDEPDMRMLVRLMLERTGDIEVVGEAASGEEALSLVAEADVPPDCLLLDYMLPGSFDGIETARRLRSLASGGSGVRIVMFSAYADERLRDLAEEVGVDRCLSKDDFARVADTIRSVVSS